MLANGRPQVLKIDRLADRFGIQENAFPAEDSKIDLFNGPIDCLTDQELFRAGSCRVAPFCRPASRNGDRQHRRAEQEDMLEVTKLHGHGKRRRGKPGANRLLERQTAGFGTKRPEG